MWVRFQVLSGVGVCGKMHLYTRGNAMHVLDPALLALLVCPLTKASLRYDAAAQELISDAAKLAFPIRDGVPILLLDEARALESAV